MIALARKKVGEGVVECELVTDPEGGHREVFCEEGRCEHCGAIYLVSYCSCGGVYVFHGDCPSPPQGKKGEGSKPPSASGRSPKAE